MVDDKWFEKSLRKDVVKEYYNSPENGKYPISKTDVHVIELFQEAISLIDRDRRVSELFNKWKLRMADEEIVKQLNLLIINLYNDTESGKLSSSSSSGGEEGEKEKPNILVSFEGYDIEVKKLHIVKRDQYYSSKISHNCMIYTIEINPADEQFVGLALKMRFEYQKEVARENAYEELREKLQATGKVKFI